MTPLSQALSRLLCRVRLTYAPQVARWAVLGGRGNPPSLDSWVLPMAEQLAPYLRPYYHAGAERSRRNVLAKLRRPVYRDVRKRLAYVVKDVQGGSLGISFDVFNPRVLEAIDNAVFAFCESTLDTLRGEVALFWRGELREELRQGLQAGEALEKLTRRVGQLFDDPQRAFTIAQTEASRGVHAGQLLAARESGVVSGLTWLASSDACKRCLALNGKTVKLGEPFHVSPKGGYYAVVYHPPLHPHCFCTATEEVDLSLVEATPSGPVPGLAARERLGRYAEVV